MNKQQFWFVTDLHGKIRRYERLFELLEKEPPAVLLIGGDFLPSHAGYKGGMQGFISEYLDKKLLKLKESLGKKYPLIFLIFGNDDPRVYEKNIQELESKGLLSYLHRKIVSIDNFRFIGYSYVPPTPFLLKDWERYDVSRFVDPGCIPPEEGRFSVKPPEDISYFTIQNDLESLTLGLDMKNTVMLLHTPPYKTALDRAALDGIMIDHIPLDLYVGSIAVSRFIENRQPLVTLHGHIHESARLTGDWKDRIGDTWCFSAAIEGDELAIVKFFPDDLSNTERIIV